MTVGNATLAKFVAALTAVDQVPATERAAHGRRQRQRDRSAVRGARYCKWVTAQAAYHRAHAAQWAAIGARVAGIGDKVQLTRKEQEAATALFAVVDDFMAVPIINGDDKKDRQTFLRKCRKAISTAGIWPQWLAAEPRWLAQIGGAA